MQFFGIQRHINPRFATECGEGLLQFWLGKHFGERLRSLRRQIGRGHGFDPSKDGRHIEVSVVSIHSISGHQIQPEQIMRRGAEGFP